MVIGFGTILNEVYNHLLPPVRMLPLLLGRDIEPPLRNEELLPLLRNDELLLEREGELVERKELLLDELR